MIVTLIEAVEPRCIPIEEAMARLVEQGVEPHLSYAVVFAAG